MNEYKIIYTVNGETYSTNRVDRTEATARRAFLKDYKEMGTVAEITNIELIRDDAIATKQQERDTLAAIKKMVEELGPQSYLATAFEGCFEDAETNIENDFGDSYKRRCESLERKLDEADETIEQMKNDIKLLSSSLDNERALVKSLEERLEQQVLDPDDITDISQLLTDKVLGLGKEVSSAAQRIVEQAENPGSAEFQNAVKEHRVAQVNLGYYTAILSRVNTIKNAG